MKQIPLKQVCNGLLMTLLKRNTTHALYEVTDLDRKHIHSYELHKIQFLKDDNDNIYEKLASNNEFGTYAWSLRPDLQYALKRFEATNKP